MKQKMDKQRRKSKPKVRQICKLLVRLIKEKKEKPKISTIKNKRGHIKIGPTYNKDINKGILQITFC